MVPQLLVEAGNDLQIFRYTLVATTFVVSYEHIITLDSEVRFFWQRGFTFGSLLLFLCRYVAILAVYFAMYNHVWTTDVRHSTCVHLITGNTLIVWFQFCLTNLVLLVRAYAVWGGQRRILILLSVMYIGGIGGTSVTIVNYIKSALPLGFIFQRGGCVYTIGDNSVKYSIIDHTFNDFMSLVLLLYKSVQHTKAMNLRAQVRRLDGSSPVSLLTVMAQDGVIYFVLNLAVAVANYIVIERASENLRDFMFGTQGALQCILCSKLLFHLYSVGQSPASAYSLAYTNYCPTTLSSGPSSGSGYSSDRMQKPYVVRKAVLPCDMEMSFEMKSMEFGERIDLPKGGFEADARAA